MFKNRSIQMKVVKDEAQSSVVENKYFYPNIMEVKNLALCAAGLYVLKSAVDTTQVIALSKFAK